MGANRGSKCHSFSINDWKLKVILHEEKKSNLRILENQTSQLDRLLEGKDGSTKIPRTLNASQLLVQTFLFISKCKRWK